MNYAPDICIDVGAARGTRSIYEAFPNAKHFAFEPMAQFLPDLRKSLAPYDHEIFAMALMDAAGELEITTTSNEYGSTLMARNSPPERRVAIPVSTLDQQLARRVAGKRTLLKTDCQGGDLSVIRGGDQVVQQCDVIIMEVSLYRFWGAHHPDLFDIVQAMRERGFLVLDILDGLFKPSNKALGQVDLAFAKEEGPLRPHSRW